ncbi:MAG: glycine--tRNA ligase [Patescibacteria group bacterium]|nr:glycine--tRNA ligase [Patescibacteria group bacterium]
MTSQEKFEKVVSLCKRRGFVFQGSEIYGGLANTYDFGSLGVEMLRNITNSWWGFFVTSRENIFGLDTSILMSSKVWEASGHTKSFSDVLIECKKCHFRTRADHLVENYYIKNKGSFKGNFDGWSPDRLKEVIQEESIPCEVCSAHQFTEPRNFNLLFQTHIGILEGEKSLAYLRGEIAQGMFVNFKNVLDTMWPKIPFGIAQAGKAFRNEITLGNFIFRTLEFNLAEFEYFFDPKNSWKEHFSFWKQEMEKWIISLGIAKSHLKWRTHTDAERAHYSTHTEDLDYKFSFGFKEIFGLAYRTDYDLRNHTEKSGVDLRYTDPQTGEKYMPHVVEPTFGINRVFLCLLSEAYTEDAGGRVFLRLNKNIAPYKVAVFPLVRNKEDIVKKAREVFDNLKLKFNTAWDDRGNIGKRYYSQDEIGTPYCVTVDYQTLEDETVTIRDRDTAKQERIKISDIAPFVTSSFGLSLY